jgi:hypothetical protein
MTDENKQEKVIRNATPEDIEKLKRKDASEGIPVSKVKKENGKKAEVLDMYLKPKKSIFEPDPFPIKLPSGNKVVKSGLTPKNEIYIKRMGSAEEGLFVKMIGSNDTKLINATMDAAIDNCIKSRIEASQLSLIDKFAVFFKIIDLTYGPIKTELKCSNCGTSYFQPLNLVKDLKIKYLPENYEYPRPIKIESFPGCNITWYVKYPTAGETQDFLTAETMTNMLILTDRIEGTLIDGDNGEREVQKSDYEDIISNLNDDDRKKFKDFLNDFGSHGVDLTIRKDFCTKSGCNLKDKVQEITFPFEAIFARILSIS